MRLLRGCALLLVVLSLSFICTLLGESSAHAGWTSSAITVDQQDESVYSFSLQGRDCKFRDGLSIKGVGVTAACVIEGTKMRLAYAASGTYVAKGRDQTFYPLSIPVDRYAVLTPDTDRLVLYRNISNYSSTFAVYENVSSAFTYANGTYILQIARASFQYSQAPQFFTFPRLSNDGHFAAFVSTNSGGTKFAVKTVDLESGETATVGYILDAEAYMRENYRDIAVSEDGEYVAINTFARLDETQNFYRTVQVWRNANCDVERSVACETRLATDNVPAIGTPSGLMFNDTATNLTLMNFSGDNYYRTTFSIEDIFRARQLDYLAMGDSYSSGEGDTDGMHYLAGTNVLGDVLHPQEMCHVSDRSYPFLLQNWPMPNAKMRSVACSGAVVREDYMGSEYGYKGQNYSLAGIPDVLRSQMKREALDISFIPGRNKQITFVKKYQPKAVTITGGGNDAGFVGFIERCAFHATTCSDSYVYRDIANAGRKIQAQYPTLLKFYRDLNAASPKTKIYAVGYPQFVSEDNDPCAVNIGMNKTERKFVREGVIMMNRVIKAAADTAGVYYIDIESALGANTLCGSSNPKYVTGISTDKPWRKASSNGFFSNESFHPNAEGHHAMANAIKSALGGKSLVEYSYCQGPAVVCPKMTQIAAVPLTPFFEVANDPSRTQIGQTFSKRSLQPLADPRIYVSTDQLGQGSATVRIESTPRTLGAVDVGEDGVLSAEFIVPTDIEPGLHTLYIDALTPAGEEITLWQHITIYGPDGDVDGNGVDDALQPCPFIIGSLQDGDNDGVDDRCDPEIERTQGSTDNLPDIDQVLGNQQPSASNFASDAAKNLLATGSRPIAQHFLSRDNIVGTPAAAYDRVNIDKQSLKKPRDNNTREAGPFSRVTSFTWISISIITTLCIIALIGFIYAKTKPKKQ